MATRGGGKAPPTGATSAWRGCIVTHGRRAELARSRAGRTAGGRRRPARDGLRPNLRGGEEAQPRRRGPWRAPGGAWRGCGVRRATHAYTCID